MSVIRLQLEALYRKFCDERGWAPYAENAEALDFAERVLLDREIFRSDEAEKCR